jgi:hypothetical protein
MSYILNLFRYHIGENVQLRVYPVEGLFSYIYVTDLLHPAKGRNSIDGLRLVDADTNEPIPTQQMEGWTAYVSSMDRNMHVYYKNKYRLTLRSTQVWRTAIESDPDPEICSKIEL